MGSFGGAQEGGRERAGRCVTGGDGDFSGDHARTTREEHTVTGGESGSLAAIHVSRQKWTTLSMGLVGELKKGTVAKCGWAARNRTPRVCQQEGKARQSGVGLGFFLGAVCLFLSTFGERCPESKIDF